MTSNVIAGEGAESDDDEAQSSSFMKNTMISSTMVSGEASETDEEEEVEEIKSPYSKPMTDSTEQLEGLDSETFSATTDDTEQPNSSSIQSKKVEKAKRHKLVYKYDSPFHRKLREKNLQLRSGIVEGVTQMYKSATLKLDSSTFHRSRAQTAVQDVAYNSKIILEDLHSLIHIMRNTEELNTLSNIKMSH
ncbi:uncharacterized protein LOC116298068 [Actinia tenebrosa]|uniref:Biogenesis of lysosome-related organelles complex 1 subunit 3 n=1 Tax=Actinia tenebrosa TaxID=6105 RepID=A0A6P8I359_ACTTE|nr:uncharacterized protein LOC116298068 [Actinia tenebrosa]